MVPRLDENDPEIAVYYAFLNYDKRGHFKNIRLSSQDAYEQLAALEAGFDEEYGGADINYNSMSLQFEFAWNQISTALPVGDAFLEYLRLYGLPVDVTVFQMTEQLKALQPQLELASKPPAEPTLVLTPTEKPPIPGLISRLFMQRRSANVVFAYPAGRTQDNWIGAHELGRQTMQSKLGDQVTSSFIDGLSAGNMYEKLSAQATDADLLLITSSELTLPSLRFSLEHPDCLTLVYSRIREDYRISTYYGRYYEASYLCGMAAAMATNTMKVAYITPALITSVTPLTSMPSAWASSPSARMPRCCWSGAMCCPTSPPPPRKACGTRLKRARISPIRRATRACPAWSCRSMSSPSSAGSMSAASLWNIWRRHSGTGDGFTAKSSPATQRSLDILRH